ncbi:hypothetical protein HK098_004310 [Nowakowskiella sp. JEL0407]|nr:hypothetical protein HK098_004310 [Nowakowskiella sp. JEL0407]
MATNPRFEEDDEFEDFAVEDWDAAAEDKEDPQLWEDSWDKEEIDDDFTRQLRAELLKPTQTATEQQNGTGQQEMQS